MVKAIFFDIDGTLVSFETHKIPASTHEALKALRDKGIKIFIATGRPQCLINNLGDLEFDGYITVNGSYCFMKHGIFLYASSIGRLYRNGNCRPSRTSTWFCWRNDCI